MKSLVFKEDIVLRFYFYDGNTSDYDSIVLGQCKQAGRGQPGKHANNEGGERKFPVSQQGK